MIEWPPEEPAVAPAPAARGASIALIEDDQYIGAAVSLYLAKRSGHIVEHFVAATDARHWLEHADCDLVITDIFMPDSDGLETIQWMRKRHPHLPVIAISGSDCYGHSFLKAARLMGATRVLAKPFELGELHALVEALLRRAE